MIFFSNYNYGFFTLFVYIYKKSMTDDLYIYMKCVDKKLHAKLYAENCGKRYYFTDLRFYFR